MEQQKLVWHEGHYQLETTKVEIKESKNEDYSMFNVGDVIEHDVLGMGTVVGFPTNVDAYLKSYHYVQVHFEADKADKNRIFLPKDLLSHLKNIKE